MTLSRTSHLFAVVITALALAAACGTSASQKNRGTSAGTTAPLGGDQNPADINAREVSLAAFKETVYPVVRAHCATCHAQQVSPYFAAPDATAAHDAIINNDKVDFADPANSRLVARLSPEQHNCFGDSCETAAKVMEDAVTAWDAKIKAAGATDNQGADNPATESRKFSTAATTAGTGPAAVIVPATAFTSLVRPFVLRTDDPDDAVTGYLVAPTRNGQVVQPTGTGATATATINVSVAGTYYLWARVKTPTNNAKSFNFSVDNGPFTAVSFPVTNDAWAWEILAPNNSPMALNLEAGKHTIIIKQREENARLNQLAISSKAAGFTGAEPPAKSLAFDLKALTGKNAKLLVDVSEFDAKSKTILLTNLRVTTDADLIIKDVMPLINGKWNPVHATYRIVDKTIKAPGGALSDSALVMIGDDGFASDELSFTFGEIK